MAAIHIYVSPPYLEQPDDLCPVCWKPALKRYIYQTVDMTGITIRGTRVACRDCQEWRSPLEPLEEPA